MSNDNMEMNTLEKMEETQSAEELKSKLDKDLEKLDRMYKTSVEEQLKKLREMKFKGTSEEGDAAENDAFCTVEMTSQYNATEVNIDPSSLLKVFSEAQIDTNNIEIDQLVHVCVSLGEAARLAFNNAREKTHKGSETIFNQLMEEMQNELFNTDK